MIREIREIRVIRGHILLFSKFVTSRILLRPVLRARIDRGNRGTLTIIFARTWPRNNGVAMPPVAT